MRKSFVFVIAFVMLGFGADMAWAKIIDMSTRVGAGQLKSACSKAGGTFGTDPFGYACVTNCKGGRASTADRNSGNYCSVSCSNAGDCKGHVPARMASKDIVGILNGNAVIKSVRVR